VVAVDPPSPADVPLGMPGLKVHEAAAIEAITRGKRAFDIVISIDAHVPNMRRCGGADSDGRRTEIGDRKPEELDPDSSLKL
jgi:hypothetical protein